MKDLTFDVWKVLDQMFDLPANIQTLDLNLTVGQLPRLDISYYPERLGDTDILVSKQFKIEPID